MTSLLIMTTGRTDVQIVVNDENGVVRRELDDKTCGTLHNQIEQRAWRVLDPPVAKAKGDKASVLPAGDLALCTPKLDAVLNYFTNELRELPVAALIFETRRKKNDDPRFAGAVLEQRLYDRGISQVQRHAFLEGNERFDDPANPLDAVVRREVVARLEQAIAGAIEGLKPTQIFAATTGGMAAVNAVIEELARLYAVPTGAKVDVLEVPDAAIAKQVDRAIEERFHPASGYRARWQALSLIEKGNLLGAWGAVAYIKDQPGQEWTRVVEWLACFASSLPIPDECDLSVLKHQRLAVRAALRVEFALRAGDIPRAAHGTVAFFEAALWDYLGDKTSRHASKRQFMFHVPPPNELVRENDSAKLAALSKTKKDENRKRPFIRKETVDGVDWYQIDDTAVCANQIAEHYLKLTSLTKFGKAVTQKIRDLRNDVAHNEPTPQLMNGARTEMQQAGLWSKDDPPRFLSQPLVQDVLKELGISQPDGLCEELLAEVRTRLLPC
ncbi:hypothetical protein [Candidatus Viridilinea mediisalina]|uniref:Uncharacterized protein n=1 Tax=Candidatus Viridilinea mediisalina TaxID=2024553 RepID=A0A2A6RDY4_9CHLR|nr:hypothetical protein [Candidatus Viridilinea mediisalina]PDW00281.1 hypothetical protein CJ255_20920 [Candidatus Viridilinea mediisalina]